MKNITRYILILAVLVIAPAASALIINIPGDYPTIQEGIDAAQNGDTVLVAPGLYTGGILIQDKNILLTSAEGPQVTTIRGFLNILGEAVDTICVIRGMTITKNVNDPYFDMRSLILVEDSSPLIVGNIVEDNETWRVGAGISCDRSGAIIRGNIIRNNLAYVQGGGIQASSAVEIDGNIISENRAGFSVAEWSDAGGLILNGPVILRYNLIIENEADRSYVDPRGGGILMGAPSHSHIYNNTIVGNSAGPYDGLGGGINFGVGPNVEDVFYKNNIIAFNPYGGGIHGTIPDSADAVWDYNLVFGNGEGDYIGIEPGPHDIQADPLFVDRFSGDYSLLSNSPCIDAGDPDFPLDPDGSRADIGAYYFDQAVGIDDPGEPSGPYQFELHQNYPNPFNAQTIISYYLTEESVVSLHIYSITGHFVAAITNKERQTSGEHKYVWDGKDSNGKMVSTGIYFYELYVDDYRESKAMIMIK